jgi:hypothetical protein
MRNLFIVVLILLAVPTFTFFVKVIKKGETQPTALPAKIIAG